MRTPDLSSFEHMSYTSPPQYPLGSRIGCFETGSENNGFDEPPPAPLAPSSTVPPPPLQYRTIKPRLSGHGTVPTTPQENLASLSQPDSTQMPASSLVLNPGARDFSSVPVRKYTDSGMLPSSQGPFLEPCAFPPSNELASPAEISYAVFPNGASKDLGVNRLVYHDNVPRLRVSSDTQVSWSEFSAQNQDGDYMRDPVSFAQYLEEVQVLQSLEILLGYMFNHPSVFGTQAPEMVQRWISNIEGAKPPGSLSK